MNGTDGSIRYPYAEGDLLERRNSYFYTPFQGAELLAAWAAQRESACGHAHPVRPSAPAKATDQLLESLRADLSGQPGLADWMILDHLLQRFEVTKRLHGTYDAHWRPVDPSDYTDLGRYLAFAEVLALAYAKRSHLPYLNGLLKVMDTLTALRGRLDAGQAGWLARLVLCEREHVEALHRRCQGVVDGA